MIDADTSDTNTTVGMAVSAVLMRWWHPFLNLY